MKRIWLSALVIILSTGFIGSQAWSQASSSPGTAPSGPSGNATGPATTVPSSPAPAPMPVRADGANPPPKTLPAPPPSHGPVKTKNSHVDLSGTNTIRLNYTNKEWNLSPTKIDSASILMREGATGRTVQINLEENAPDSAVFSGLYSINWQNLDRLQVEFYIPPQDLLKKKDGLTKVVAMINNHELKRLPFVLRKSATGQQTIEIYDTKEQARTAMEAFRAEQQIFAQQDQNQNFQNRKFPSDDQINAAKVADELKARQAAEKSLADRKNLQLVESAKISDLVTKFTALTPAEQASKRKVAAEAAARAMALYKEGKFPEAKAEFETATVNDPLNRAYYFQYGVTLYKTDQYNESIVLLNLADAKSINPAERDYYVALDFFKLKEYDHANQVFDKIIATKDPELAPSSQFYKGFGSFQQQRWDEAKTNFQTVLDTSKDKTLDERAENYITQILRIQQFEAERARKWRLTGMVGEMYDTNILLSTITSPDQGTATNTKGYRSLFAGSARYRPVYDETHEFAVQADLLEMYSSNTSFKFDQGLHNVDPTVLGITAPWTHKGLLWTKGYKFDFIPGYEITWMSIDNNTTKAILHSYYVDLNNLLIMNERWFHTFLVEIRKDEANLTESVGDNDSSAYKLKGDINEMFLFSEQKNKIVIADASLTLNEAVGDNELYNRIDLSATYMQPFYWGTTGSAKLAYYFLNYPEKAPSETDNNESISLGATKPINSIYTAGLLASYANNASTVATNSYSKFSVLLTFSALYAF